MATDAVRIPTASLQERKSVQPHPSNTMLRAPVIIPALNADEAKEVLNAAGPLGNDPGCTEITGRSKSIGYYLCLAGKWIQIDQATICNSSGPGAQTYQRLPSSFLENQGTVHLLDTFKTRNYIPDGKLVLVQLHSTDIKPNRSIETLSGMTAHTDGADAAMVACLRRKNISGARNAFVQDKAATKLIGKPLSLVEGDAVLWDDNKMFHVLEPARLEDDKKPGNRTVFIALYPATQYITGKRNKNNLLMALGSERRKEKIPSSSKSESAIGNKNYDPKKMDSYIKTIADSSIRCERTTEVRGPPTFSNFTGPEDKGTHSVFVNTVGAHGGSPPSPEERSAHSTQVRGPPTFSNFTGPDDRGNAIFIKFH